MLNLIKHEFLKSRSILIVVSAIFAIIEIIFLISGFSGINGIFIVSSMLIVFFISFIVFGYLIYSLMLYDMDISHKHKNGYMVFMTPNSTYKIIGSKLLASTIVEIVFGIIVSLIFIMDIKLSFKFTSIAIDSNFLNDFSNITAYISDIPFSTIFLMYLNTFSEFTLTVAVIYLSRMLYDTVFYNIKAGAAIAFGCFILINIIFGFIQMEIMKIFNINMFNENEIIYETTVLNVYFGGYSGLIVPTVLNIIFIAVSYIATCILCDKKLSI
jgi:hypothetical protein